VQKKKPQDMRPEVRLRQKKVGGSEREVAGRVKSAKPKAELRVPLAHQLNRYNTRRKRVKRPARE
jgi:hypothetical protein